MGDDTMRETFTDTYDAYSAAQDSADATGKTHYVMRCPADSEGLIEGDLYVVDSLEPAETGHVTEIVKPRILYLTDAPEVYDGFATSTVIMLPYRSAMGRLRVARIKDEYTHWQTTRYASGLHFGLEIEKAGSYPSLEAAALATMERLGARFTRIA